MANKNTAQHWGLQAQEFIGHFCMLSVVCAGSQMVQGACAGPQDLWQGIARYARDMQVCRGGQDLLVSQA